jgi:hypothetical protein
VADVPLSVEQVVRTGLAATYNGTLSTDNTYQVANDGKVILHVVKTEAVDCDVTFTAPGTYYGMTFADHVVTVAGTTGNVFIGPFPPQVFSDAAGNVEFTLSDVDGLTIAVLHLA